LSPVYMYIKNILFVLIAYFFIESDDNVTALAAFFIFVACYNLGILLYADKINKTYIKTMNGLTMFLNILVLLYFTQVPFFKTYPYPLSLFIVNDDGVTVVFIAI